MDRTEVEEVAGMVRQALEDSSPCECRFEIVGGYRRGKEHNNDVDILISPVEQETIEEILAGIVSTLRASSVLADVLQYSEGHVPSRSSPFRRATPLVVDRTDKCLCVLQSPSQTQPGSDRPQRRVDIVVAPQSQWAFALLGWTGSGQFERSIRLWARKEKGLVLASHALVDESTGEAFSAQCEEDIFKLLGLEFIEPHLRNC